VVRTAPEDLLRDGLAGPVSVPAGLGVKAHARWRRRRAWRRALLGGATAGLAVVVAMNLTVGSKPAAPDPPRAAAHLYIPPTAANAANLVQRVTEPLSPASALDYLGFVEPSATKSPRFIRPVTVQRNYRGRTIIIFYARPGVKVSTELDTQTRKQTVEMTVVYANRTWIGGTSPNSSGQGSNPWWCPPRGNPYLRGSTAGELADQVTGWARAIATLLACPFVTVDRTPVRVDGQETIELSESRSMADLGDGWSLWVNPVTYLPVRLFATNDSNPPNLYPYQTSEYYFQWLPPTRTNLATFKLTLPRGYKRSAPGK
jgi:hypothetical protein